MENLNNLDSLSNFSNDNLDYNDIQKMIFLNNALSDGWTIRKICRNKYELIKNKEHFIKKEIDLENFIKSNLNIDNLKK